jgi:hypothetical protein
MTRAVVEQPHDLRIEVINGLAMVRNIHRGSECRKRSEESNLFNE